MENLSGISKNNIFKPISDKLDVICKLPHTKEKEINKALSLIEQMLELLNHTYLNISSEMNAHSVQAAMIKGKTCIYVKKSLLHGAWTTWAEYNFTESLRTLEKFMAIAKSKHIESWAYLGTEKIHQLTRIEHLLAEDNSFEDLFSDAELDINFNNYSFKDFKNAITTILNKQTLKDYQINITNESLKTLTDNFMLIKDNQNVLTRLAEAKSEDANLDKAVTNITTTDGAKRSLKKKKGTKHKEDINNVLKTFIERFQEVSSDPEARKKINNERILFVAKLIGEFLGNNQVNH